MRTLNVGEGEVGVVLDLLLDHKAKGCQHSHTAMCQLRLAPPLDLGSAGVAGAGVAEQVGGVEHVGEGVRDAGHSLGVCGTRNGSSAFRAP